MERMLFQENEIPELIAENHKAYFDGVRYPLLRENPYVDVMR